MNDVTYHALAAALYMRGVYIRILCS